MKKLFKNAYLSSVFFFLYLPIAVLIIFSFNESKSRSVFTGFTFDWYTQLLGDELIISSLVNTLVVAAVAAIVATIVGTAAAVGIFSMKRFSRKVTTNITNIPVVNPEIITAISLLLLFAFIELGLGFTTLIIAHITFCLPYVILSVMPKLRQMDFYIFEAAQDLGCTPAKAFFKVVIPQIMPGITTGFLLALTFSLDDFVISYFTSGPTSQTLPITIFSMTRRKVSPKINAISAIIFLVALSALVLYNIKDARDSKKRAAKALINKE